MRKTLTAFVCIALIAASTTVSSAAPSDRARKAERATATYNDSFRRSNASLPPRLVEVPALNGSLYNGAMSAPAGR